MDLNNWFVSRGLKTLQYQEDIINDFLPKSLKQNVKPTVLAASPSAGKTIMSIAFIEKYLTENKGASVLVLTHGTTILRSQYYEELELLKPLFTYSHIETKADTINNKSQVWVALPQTLIKGRGKNKVKLKKFDLLIVDEAHQFYFAPMVKNIIKEIKPRHQILLTGTPSKFILHKYPIIPVTIRQLLEYGMISDVTMKLASSVYNFDNDDYNQDDNLKTAIKTSTRSTNVTLDKVLDKICVELRSKFKNNPKAYNIIKTFGANDWRIVLKALNKTMFACNSQEQARQVEKYLTSKGVDCALSTSDTDSDSSEIQRFKKDKNCLVLIVVYRGILGFNYPELENIVDMSMTRNIDRIFQLMARVLRKHPENNTKFYFKVVPDMLAEYFQHVMNCVLSLCHEDWYLRYNGKNFLDMEVPVEKPKKKRGTKSNETTGSKNRPFKAIEIESENAIQFFLALKHENNEVLNSYAYTSMDVIRQRLLFDKDLWTKEKVYERFFI